MTGKRISLKSAICLLMLWICFVYVGMAEAVQPAPIPLQSEQWFFGGKANGQFYKVAYGNAGIFGGPGGFVAVGKSDLYPETYDTLIGVSVDGASWTFIHPGQWGTHPMYDVAYGNGNFVAVGKYGSTVYTTTGISAEQPVIHHFAPQQTNYNLYGIANYGPGGFFVAVGESGVITTSRDGGATWRVSRPPLGTPEYIYQLNDVKCYDDGIVAKCISVGFKYNPTTYNYKELILTASVNDVVTNHDLGDTSGTIWTEVTVPDGSIGGPSDNVRLTWITDDLRLVGLAHNNYMKVFDTITWQQVYGPTGLSSYMLDPLTFIPSAPWWRYVGWRGPDFVGYQVGDDVLYSVDGSVLESRTIS